MIAVKGRIEVEQRIVAHELLATKNFRYSGNSGTPKSANSVAVMALENGDLIFKAPYEESEFLL